MTAVFIAAVLLIVGAIAYEHWRGWPQLPRPLYPHAVNQHTWLPADDFERWLQDPSELDYWEWLEEDQRQRATVATMQNGQRALAEQIQAVAARYQPYIGRASVLSSVPGLGGIGGALGGIGAMLGARPNKDRLAALLGKPPGDYPC